MKKHYSVIVVGAGSVGMSAGYYLAKKGVDTLLIDAFDPPHGKGSHHGETRLIRHATDEGEEYISLALRAQELWHQLEEESDKPLFIPSGTLTIGQSNTFIKGLIKSANKYSIPSEELNANEIHKRWPQFLIPNNFTGYFEPLSGALLSENCILAFRQLATQNKATLLTNSKVMSIDFFEKGVSVSSEKGTFNADKVIICAGAWTEKILESLSLQLQTVRKTFGWFETNDILFHHTKLPCFYYKSENSRFYGFSNINDSGIKVGESNTEREINPDLMNQDFGKYDNDERDLKEFLKGFLPSVTNNLKNGMSCMITKTPDKHFILDHHPEYNHVLIAGGFSGHGFKYSSVLGEILSQLVINGRTSHSISKFSITRSGLMEK